MKNRNNTFIILTIIIVLVWFTSFLIFSNFYSKPSNSAEFGDSFGAINALFSGLALAGIIYTISLQRKELKLQRKELKLNREEYKRSANAQEQQNKNFENDIGYKYLPLFRFEFKIQRDNNYIEIINTSQNNAFDVLIDIILNCDYDEYPKPLFIESDFIIKKYKKKCNPYSTKHWFSIHQKEIIPSIASGEKKLINLYSPYHIYGCDFTIQYRDIAGNNRIQYIDIVNNKIINSEPKLPTISNRLELKDYKIYDETQLTDTTAEKFFAELEKTPEYIPQYLTGFIKSFRISIPSEYIDSSKGRL